ncbi:MAG: peptidylprolyl isomerase [Lactobacillus sp.]|uniref:Foldase protein PrsA n=1 Tax=Bombilactobacillus bombi TaxID=1303590 RepID=A0A347SQF7_9LACO|nr:peptidylprolyl isomerase PrsA [Bombilactobacillus bombi]MCO6542277.1 peptidylprolyl isomerase [Lactobacillus sp.]AXX64266.1 peptidylprolyl isomerase [Bombilactobacillus bombi]MCO6543114.1 peptidylprolyl isomerase [Lactobacillus sp.]RHW48436.1 peptidylprolyl isomerase [Bombilactobacillus bombi]RHW50261.1 peptidylprolyl isomerase [Bombilactobacillus bombi]
MSKKFNKIILTIVALLSVSLVAGCSGNKAVVTMKGGKITQEQLYQKMKKSQAGQQALQQMIISQALKDQYGKNVSDKEVNKEYNQYKDKYGSQFDSLLQQNGMDAASFKDTIRTNLLTKVAVRKETSISKAELNKQWKKYTPKVTVQHILVKDEDTAKDVIKQLDDGGNFDKLAKKYSTDTGTKNNGGKLPSFNNSDTSLDANFKKAALKLKQGQYTKEPVKSSYGYHIIKMDKRPSKGTLNSHKQELENQIYAERMQDSVTMQKVISKVLKRSDISIKDNDMKNILAGYLSNGKDSNKNAKSSSK